MLSSSGQISLSQVQTEFGGGNPISLLEYKNNNHGGPLANMGTFYWGQWDGKYRLGGMHGRKSGGYEALGVTNSSWTVPAGTFYIYAYFVAGGGGGGMYHYFTTGYGGGSGGYYWPIGLNATGEFAPGQSVSYAVGGGGPTCTGAEWPGGSSNFGSYVATGGVEGGYEYAVSIWPGYGGSPNGVSSTGPPGASAGLGGPGDGGNGAPWAGSGTVGNNGTMYIRWYS